MVNCSMGRSGSIFGKSGVSITKVVSRNISGSIHEGHESGTKILGIVVILRWILTRDLMFSFGTGGNE